MLEITLGYARANGAHYNNIPALLVTRWQAISHDLYQPCLRALSTVI
jgi:hypothetical protein